MEERDLMSLEGLLKLNADLISRAEKGNIKENELKALNAAIQNQLRAIQAARLSKMTISKKETKSPDEIVAEFVKKLPEEIQDMILNVVRGIGKPDSVGEDKKIPA